MVRIYGKRWDIEVLLKTAKKHPKRVKEIQCRCVPASSDSVSARGGSADQKKKSFRGAATGASARDDHTEPFLKKIARDIRMDIIYRFYGIFGLRVVFAFQNDVRSLVGQNIDILGCIMV